ncbi:MAG: hypothetical protein HYR60_24055 [Acidobacteria bacterium]|nr:hypothetical protein [Acidobacteriota bacterium]
MEQLAALLLTTAGACLFAILTLFLWREYRIERFRQRIFQIRDELFDFAAEGNLSFDNPAYGALRASMNSMIRFAHRMSLSYAVGITAARHFCPSPGLDRFTRERLRPLMELPEGPAREKLVTLHARVLIEVFKFVSFSPLLLPVLPFALLAFIAGTASSLYRRLTKERDEIAVTIELQALECDQEPGDSFGRLQVV